MKIGDYIRTDFKDEHIIAKIIGLIKDLDGSHYIKLDRYTQYFYYDDKPQDFKSSPNIIDLIEEQDLIKYRISGDEYVGEVKGHPEFDKYVLHIEYLDTIINLKDLDIVSIVTREQFESMEYKVGE